MQSNYITIEEVSVAFGVTNSTVYRWIESEKVPSPIRLGGIKWNKENFSKWVKDNHSGVILPTLEKN